MATIGTPLDICRTRIMNQPAEGEKLYNGFIDCFRKIVKTEGPLGLYKGFFPIWGRIAPTTCIQLMTFEKLRQFAGLGTI